MNANDCCERSIEEYDLSGELGSLEKMSPQPKLKDIEVTNFKCIICRTAWRRSVSYAAGGILWENFGAS